MLSVPAHWALTDDWRGEAILASTVRDQTARTCLEGTLRPRTPWYAFDDARYCLSVRSSDPLQKWGLPLAWTITQLAFNVHVFSDAMKAVNEVCGRSLLL